MGLMGYGNSWRAHRRLFHQYFRSTIVFTYHPSSTKAVREMIRRLRDTPDHFMRHIRFMAGSNILRIVYGMEVESEDDPNLALVEEGIKIVSRIANAGAYLVDSFPIMQHIPAWFPGAQFKRDGARWKPIVEEMFTRPYKELKASFDNGDPKPCVLTSMLYNISQDEEDPNRSMLEDVVINTSGTTYIAASDTTTSTLHTFVLAMSMHPELQKRAQEELGDIVGQDRLPEMGDRDALPFITAIVKECLRWRPALPLASPHRSVTDDEYEGFYIPAGSLVIGNAWAILHDKERYPDPDTFNPSRFINREGRLRKDVPDPTEAFGWGRRICPGRYFFLDLAWLAAANILAVFSIEKPIDELGNVVEPSGEYTTGLFSFPVPFKATFKVRSNVGVLV
ncbi:uncharacterized protein PHACADRAFT_265797 [Phanerochaete carnosa HHB-10118-sp]|uniref:Cytochrome P450 n=1 Tax=Phanerochaete carnosa (strain HHB-10118-sp) TaxID=650164 RepID=K5VQW9_PHACS|nr:uncharacterized protein PHACADRAFT_265797 [Phanerochaete carnosa HHB-10118-sp]EKM49140.1 hypothetical protein PHACADRAFT_265797 [Phanerochaete carnosa HHB-10118-sp]